MKMSSRFSGPETSKSRKITIVFHEKSRREHLHKYRIFHLAEIWKRNGFDVQMMRGNCESVRAGVLIPQIDLSVFPSTYRQLLNSDVRVINRRVVDIRKSTFSRNLVSLHDDYHGPVIVKTNANYGGLSDRSTIKALPWHRKMLERLRRASLALHKIVLSGSFNPLAYASTLSPDSYPVFMSKHQLPRAVFKNKDLIVEKFLPEKQGQFFYTRSYAFLGDVEVVVRMRSEFPVVKASSETELEFVAVDDTIAATRRELGFDYGKFDYVLHDGEAVLLDINTTPTFGKAYGPEIRTKIATQLAKGISKWFPEL